MKIFLKIHFALCLGVWFVLYSVYCFISFEIHNPIYILINLPNYTSEDRAGIIGCFIIINLIVGVISNCIKESIFDKDKKASHVDISSVSLPSSSTIKETVYYPVETQKSGPDALDIAVGFGTGMIGAEIISDVFLDD